MLSVKQATQFMGNMLIYDVNSLRRESSTVWDLGESVFKIQQRFNILFSSMFSLVYKQMKKK